MRNSMLRSSARGVTPWSAIILVAAAAACSSVVPPVLRPEPQEEAPRSRINTSRELVREMHDRYADNWYRTLRFEQSNTFYTQSGKEEKSRWVESLSVPGRLRIDFQPLSSKSGLLILNNRVITFDNGRRVDSRRSIQPILTLTADIYAIPPAVTLRRLDSLRIDLDKFHETRLGRRRVFVMGAEDGDIESNQVWIEADRLLLVRLIQRDQRGERVIVTDTRVGEYKDIDGFPVAHEYVSNRDGKPYFREEYDNVRVNEPIPSALFDPTKWASVRPASLQR